MFALNSRPNDFLIVVAAFVAPVAHLDHPEENSSAAASLVTLAAIAPATSAAIAGVSRLAEPAAVAPERVALPYPGDRRQGLAVRPGFLPRRLPVDWKDEAGFGLPRPLRACFSRL